MTALLSPGHPQHIADLFEHHDIEWERGWGDHDKHTCLHGALLRPCAEPGDEIMWSALISYRGATTGWNDDQDTVEPVIARLREMSDPDEAEMVAAFGPDWKRARWVCRTWAQATDEQRWAARDAWAARGGWAARAARAACAAWGAWDAWAARAAWGAWDAWAARAAFLAVVTRHMIGGDDAPTTWTEDAYARLIAPFESVFGTIPD